MAMQSYTGPHKTGNGRKNSLFSKGLQLGLLADVAMKSPKTVKEATKYASSFEHR